MKAFVASILLSFAATLAAQSGAAPEPLPPPDPGYHLYFHSDQGEMEKPERWGYHDGWMQGRADRSSGQERDLHDAEVSTKGRLHGRSGTLPEAMYLRVYRSAFLRGYEHGYRL